MPAFQSTREISGAVTPTTNDDGGMLDATADATVTLTTSGWTVGRSAIGFGVKGASTEITFAAGSGVTLRNQADDYVAGTRYTACWCRYTATGEWTIYDTEPPQLPDGSIVGAKLADDTIGSAKLATFAATSPKIADLAVTTGKLADGAVTLAKQANVTGPTTLGRVSGTGAPQELTPAQQRQASQTAGPIYTPEQYGAVGDGTTDDAAAIQEAIDAASTARGGIVWLGGRYGFEGELLVKGLVNLQGPNGAQRFTGGTEALAGVLVALDASASVVIGGAVTSDAQGGTTCGITIDGNDIGGAGTSDGLFVVDGVAQRSFSAVVVTRSAGRGAVFLGAQNCSIVDLSTTRHDGDGYVIDGGSGGLVFSQPFANANGGWGLVVDETTGGAGPYAQPTHITIVGAMIERENYTTGTTNGGAYIGDCRRLHFINPTFSYGGGAGTVSGAVVRVDDASATVKFDSATFSSTTLTAISGLHQVNGAVTLSGIINFIGCFVGWEYVAGTASIDGRPTYAGCTTELGGSGNPRDIGLVVPGQVVTELRTGQTRAWRVIRDAERSTGFRFQVLDTGALQWNDGSSFTAATSLTLSTDRMLLSGGLRVSTDLEIDGALNHDGSTAGFFGTTPAARPTGVAVTAEGIHAALVTLGLITA